MAETPSGRDCPAIRGLLRDVEDLIDGGKWSLDQKAAAKWRERPWAGAGLVICESLPARAGESDTYVVSPYVVELSWLVQTLQTVCSGVIDYANKYAFYGRLADAANRYLSQRLPAKHHPKDLCFALVREATRFVEDVERGELSVNRNEVRIKRVWVQLHPRASSAGAGLAVYWIPADTRASLANETFVFRDRQYCIGESTVTSSSGDEVLHVATYHDVG